MQQLIQVLAGIRVQGHADGHPDLQGDALVVHRLLDGAAQAPGDRLQHIGRDVLQQHDELVPAPARHRVVLTYGGLGPGATATSMASPAL